MSAGPRSISADAIPVLDHGFVRLVDHMGSDLSVSRAARVSYDAPPREEDEKLIRYLWKNNHTSPFEAVTLTFKVKAPIFVLRQWHRHRTWSYNELSARYRPLPEEFYVPKADQVGVQSKDNKQMREMVKEMPPRERTRIQTECDALRRSCERAFRDYRALLEMGWPRELARSALPLATYSHMFATVNLLNLFRFCGLRLHEHAQYEIRVYAEAMIELAQGVAPISVAAFQDGREG